MWELGRDMLIVIIRLNNTPKQLVVQEVARKDLTVIRVQNTGSGELDSCKKICPNYS